METKFPKFKHLSDSMHCSFKSQDIPTIVAGIKLIELKY